MISTATIILAGAGDQSQIAALLPKGNTFTVTTPRFA